ncbi:SRPBCC family protein [Streptomyces sudanensis]|uniref:SRPBCC family protein n=1 Tax=Streptomyces sudanensis TaxID=436397 RepID=UPI0035590C0F
MAVCNVHERLLAADESEVGALIDTLASGERDLLWPGRDWSPMRFDRPLGPGAAGGHGLVGYTVSGYLPGRWVRFEFTRPRGFHGFHELAVLPAGPGRTRIHHALAMSTSGLARLTWPLAFRPLHDALLEEASTGPNAPAPEPWPVRPAGRRTYASCGPWSSVRRAGGADRRTVPRRAATPRTRTPRTRTPRCRPVTAPGGIAAPPGTRDPLAGPRPPIVLPPGRHRPFPGGGLPVPPPGPGAAGAWAPSGAGVPPPGVRWFHPFGCR